MFTPFTDGEQILCDWDEEMSRGYQGQHPRTPFKNGVLVDQPRQEAVLDFVFSNFGIDTNTVEHPVVITEAPCAPKACSSLLTELLFEVYQVPSVCMGIDALFSLFGHNIYPQNGIVVSSGFQTTHVLPIVENMWVPSQSKRINVGGDHGTKLMRDFLRVKYPTVASAITYSCAEYIKGLFGYVAPVYAQELELFATPSGSSEKGTLLRLPQTKEQNYESLKKKQQEDKLYKSVECARRKQIDREAYLQKLRGIQQLKSENSGEYEIQLSKLNMTEDELRKTIHNVGSALSRAKKSIEKHSQLPVIPEENVNWPKYRELFDMQQKILDKKAARKTQTSEQDNQESDQENTELETISTSLLKLIAEENEDSRPPIQITVERVRIPEVVFQPSIIGVHQMGLAEAVETVLQKHPECSNTIFITGGNTLFPNFGSRIATEIRKITPCDEQFTIVESRDSIDSWRGAAHFSQDSSHQTAFITREQVLIVSYHSNIFSTKKLEEGFL